MVFCVVLSSSTHDGWHATIHGYGHRKGGQNGSKSNKGAGSKSNKGTGGKSDKDGSKSGKSHKDFYHWCEELLTTSSKSR